MVMDAENLDFDQKFDVIWVVAAITHFPEQEKFIESVSRYLNPKGKFVIFDWMANEDVDDVAADPYLKQVSERMLVARLFSMDTYIDWFKKYGYSIRYTEDITANTTQTWSDAFPQIKRLGVLKLVKEAAKHHNRDIFGFLLSFGAMKRAIQKGRLKAGIIVAEKL
jgi:SAM-dependent methyltransferase